MIHLSCLQPAARADDWLAWKVSTHPRGMLCPSPEGTRRVRTVGSTKHRHVSNGNTARGAISPDWRTMRRPCWGLRTVQELGWPSLPHPVQSRLSDRASLVPGVAAAPPPSAPPSCLSHLPTWPSNRRAWPPSRSVRQTRSVGEAALRPRERCRQGVAKEAPEYPSTSW